jgi:carbon-monoxide dehydrogenase large subunit
MPASCMRRAKILGRPGEMDRRPLGQLHVSDQHGRDHDFDAELALDKDGTFLAVRLKGYANLGAYLSQRRRG